MTWNFVKRECLKAVCNYYISFKEVQFFYYPGSTQGSLWKVESCFSLPVANCWTMNYFSKRESLKVECQYYIFFQRSASFSNFGFHALNFVLARMYNSWLYFLYFFHRYAIFLSFKLHDVEFVELWMYKSSLELLYFFQRSVIISISSVTRVEPWWKIQSCLFCT